MKQPDHDQRPGGGWHRDEFAALFDTLSRPPEARLAREGYERMLGRIAGQASTDLYGRGRR